MLYYNHKERKEVLKMKATGIVRRIDDLGRIVIPKEIRRNIGLREGEALKIFLHFTAKTRQKVNLWL